MIIGVDVDDVIADFSGAVLKHLKQKHGVELDFEEWTEYMIEDSPKFAHMREKILDSMEDIFAGDSALHFSVNPDAPGILKDISERHQVFFITARGRDFKFAKAHTLRWLESHSIPFHALHFEHDKHVIAKNLKVDLFIEDSPKNSLLLAKEGIPVLLMDKPYNKGVKHELITRVKGWKDIDKEIAKIEGLEH